jgi:adenine specific DNA methylase Mod
MTRFCALIEIHGRVELKETSEGCCMTSALYYGEHLAVLRDSIADEAVDLIYLDSPFNSNASYNVLFKAPSGEGSQAPIEAFEDTWHWNESAKREEALQRNATALTEIVKTYNVSHMTISRFS